MMIAARFSASIDVYAVPFSDMKKGERVKFIARAYHMLLFVRYVKILSVFGLALNLDSIAERRACSELTWWSEGFLTHNPLKELAKSKHARSNVW